MLELLFAPPRNPFLPREGVPDEGDPAVPPAPGVAVIVASWLGMVLAIEIMAATLALYFAELAAIAENPKQGLRFDPAQIPLVSVIVAPMMFVFQSSALFRKRASSARDAKQVFGIMSLGSLIASGIYFHFGRRELVSMMLAFALVFAWIALVDRRWQKRLERSAWHRGLLARPTWFRQYSLLEIFMIASLASLAAGSTAIFRELYLKTLY